MAIEIELTASSQLRSANTVSDIANHTGLENREKFNHKNPDIDTTKTKHNEVINITTREKLLHEHYDERIKKHNQNNNSAARRWDTLDDFLNTFEGKTVKIGGRETKNVRWATASQISYLGGKDSLNPLIEALSDAGAPAQLIRDTYTEGYKNYVDTHNAEFKTLPIYRSDLHFDETTFHGHDAIVVKGHTKTGRPSDSINNAIAEHYDDYQPTFKGKKNLLSRYREDNDALIFNSIGVKLEELCADYGLDVELYFIRTGQHGSLDMEAYKDEEERKKRLADLKKKDIDEIKELNRKSRANSRKIANKRTQELNKLEGSLDTKKTKLDAQERSMGVKSGLLDKRELKVSEDEEKLSKREQAIVEKENKLKRFENMFNAVALAVVDGDPRRQKFADGVRQGGVFKYKAESVQRMLTESLEEVNKGFRRRQVGTDYSIRSEIKKRERDNDGPTI